MQYGLHAVSSSKLFKSLQIQLGGGAVQNDCKLHSQINLGQSQLFPGDRGGG